MTLKKTWIIVAIAIVLLMTIFIFFSYGFIAENIYGNNIPGVRPHSLIDRYNYFVGFSTKIERSNELYYQTLEIVNQTERGDYSNVSKVNYLYSGRGHKYSLPDMVATYDMGYSNSVMVYNVITPLDYYFINTIRFFKAEKPLPLFYPEYLPG